ncbi:hypothetical protein EV127DRAFT_221101 [Xylaria flabelliformis]|nr:hypothetical protein EV127DRAFT_221101 [Xylaria flabelliformis]
MYAAIRKSRFKLPTLPSMPIIMITACTGITVVRGFIQKHTLSPQKIFSLAPTVSAALMAS